MLNISGSITSGSVSQTLIDPKGQPYRGFWVRNTHPTLSLWINENGAATLAAPSLEIRPYELYETPANASMFTDTVNIIGTNATHSFSGRMW